MKQIIKSIFEYIGNPDNFAESVLLIMIYTLFVIMIGMGLAWVVNQIIEKEVNKPISFDDLIQHTNRNSAFRKRRSKQVK